MLVYVVSTLLHESAHAVVAFGFGGAPRLITSTQLHGDWSALREVGFLFMGIGGPLVNGVLALVGWRVFERWRRRGHGLGVLLAWLTFAVNAWVASGHLALSPTFAFGDWMTVLANMPNAGLLRVSAALIGVVLCAQLFKGTVRTLAQLTGNGPESRRVAEGLRVGQVAWMAGGAVALLAASFDPLEPAQAMLVAGVGTFGTTWPILAAALKIGEYPERGARLTVERSLPLIALAALVATAFVFLFGRGITV